MTDTPLIWIDDATPLPPTALALGPHSDAPGLLAAGGTVTPARLEQAYRRGIFPWYSPGQPVLWWAPDPRMVLPVDGLRLSHSLRKTLRRFSRSSACQVRVDSAFGAVMQACANTPRHGQNGTWIVPEMVAAYSAWHRAGRAHSVETWVDGQLVGGLYGVSIGRMFFGESMFAHRTDASKVALAALVALCRRHGITLIDCQQHTRHLASLGAREIPRTQFEGHLAQATAAEDPADWTYHPALWTLLGLDRPAPDEQPGPTPAPTEHPAP